MRRAPCPAAEQLAVYVEGTVSARERNHLEAHLAGCADCAGILAGVVGFQEDTRAPSRSAELPWTSMRPRAAPADTTTQVHERAVADSDTAASAAS